MPRTLTPEEKDRLEEIKHELFNLANSKAGNDSGNGTIYLHESVNYIMRAIEEFDSGNHPSRGISMSFALRSMDLGK